MKETADCGELVFGATEFFFGGGERLKVDDAMFCCLGTIGGSAGLWGVDFIFGGCTEATMSARRIPSEVGGRLIPAGDGF